MTADFNKPANADSYLDVPDQIVDNIEAVAKMDYTSASNIPTGAVRSNNSGGTLDKYNGSGWTELNISSRFNAIYNSFNSLTTYVPTITEDGTLSLTTTNPLARNAVIGKVIYIDGFLSVGSLSGTGAYIEFSLNVASDSVDGQQPFAATVRGTGFNEVLMANIIGGKVRLSRNSLANFPASSSLIFRFAGHYYQV